MNNEEYKHLLDEWDYEKNEMSPNEVTNGKRDKVWWLCKKGHSYNMHIYSRVLQNSGCPYCSGRYAIKGENDLATTHHHLLKEWDYSKNIIKPDEILAGSSKNAWWICSVGHSYECRIGHHTSNKVGCPYCSGQKVLEGYNDLCTTHPELVKEWNYSKNIKSPKEFSKGSNIKVWWVCRYGHEWEANVNHRARGQGCPICSGNKIVENINDLKTWCEKNNKTYILKEWNYDRNIIKPSEVAKASNKKVWWVCDKGHEWEANISNRVRKGYGCPYCSNQKVLKGYNDFATIYPELLSEWDYEKNSISPDEIAGRSSNQKVWWKCKSGHSWFTSISHRTLESTGCPTCFSERQTSFSEQAIYYYIKQIFSEALNSYTIDNKFKLDVFIPSLSLGIEYDGSAWHQDINKDIRKNELCKDKGIRLIRVREEGCPKMSDNSFLKIINCKAIDIKKYIYDLDGSIKDIFYIIEQLLGKKIVIDVNVERDRNVIYSMYKQNKYEKSIKYLKPDLMKEWDYELNVGLDPSMFTLGSQTKVHWICQKGHKYEAIISNRTKEKNSTGCPYCSNQKVLQGYNDLASKYPHLLEEWDYSKNIDILPTEISYGAELSVWWKCKYGHSWKAMVSSRTGKQKSGCPYCSNHKILRGYNDLATVYPILLKEWDFEKNVDISPYNIAPKANKYAWWKCEKGHSWKANINSRNGGKNGCPICSKKQILQGYNDLATTHPKLLEEWNLNKNKDISPYLITSGNRNYVWWRCKKCGFEWSATVLSRVNGSGCPKCASLSRGKALSKKVINLDTNEIFQSLREAAEYCGLKKASCITECCKGRAKTAGGYHWAYYEEKE